jgi:hypothetical protein
LLEKTVILFKMFHTLDVTVMVEFPKKGANKGVTPMRTGGGPRKADVATCTAATTKTSKLRERYSVNPEEARIQEYPIPMTESESS